MILTIDCDYMDRLLDPEPNAYRASIYAVVRMVLADGGAVIVQPGHALCRTPFKNPLFVFDEPSDLSQWNEMIALLKNLNQKRDNEYSEELKDWLEFGCKRK